MDEFERVLFDGMIEIPTIPLICHKHFGFDINHEGKNNHLLSISFYASPNNPRTVKFYLLNNDQFENYVIPSGGVNDPNPSGFIHHVKSDKLENYNLPIQNSTRIHLIFANQLSDPIKIPIKLTIKETWKPESSSSIAYSGIPLQSNQLPKKIREMINTSSKSLKIISPYTDLHLIEELESIVKKKIDIKLIVRKTDENDSRFTHDVKQAFPHLQRLLQSNLKQNDKVHARLIIKDENEALIMSSDLKQDSMHDLINCGISVTDLSTVSHLSTFFNDVWNLSKNTSK